MSPGGAELNHEAVKAMLAGVKAFVEKIEIPQSRSTPFGRRDDELTKTIRGAARRDLSLAALCLEIEAC